jgi:hypothetical protein
MAYLFVCLFFLSCILLTIGFISPKTALFWKKGRSTRLQSTIIYFLISFVSLIGVGLTATPEMRREIDVDKAANAREDAGNDNAKSAPAPLTKEETEMALAKSCDTIYNLVGGPEKYLHDTGYIIDPFDVMISGSDWQKGPWTLSTYRQTGPGVYDEDDKKRLELYKSVRVLDARSGHTGDFDEQFLLVSPLGSNEQYLILARDFSLKNVNACTLLQKAKNGFFARAEYVAPTDPDKRPVDDAGGKWIDVPAGAHILVEEYNIYHQTIDGKIYDKDGVVYTVSAHFYPETLREIK